MAKFKVLSKQNNSDMCFVCGMSNKYGVKAMFYNCENEAGEKVLLTVLQPQEEFQSYPGRMHGGIASALLDEAMGRAVQVENPDMWGVTMDLCVKYRKPTPLDKTLYMETKIAKISSRAFEGEGYLFTEYGTKLVTATARFIILPPDKISAEVLDEKNWYLVPEELPEFIETP